MWSSVRPTRSPRAIVRPMSNAVVIHRPAEVKRHLPVLGFPICLPTRTRRSSLLNVHPVGWEQCGRLDLRFRRRRCSWWTNPPPPPPLTGHPTVYSKPTSSALRHSPWKGLRSPPLEKGIGPGRPLPGLPNTIVLGWVCCNLCQAASHSHSYVIKLGTRMFISNRRLLYF
ncbi:hypothetical protein LX36DRAFT_219081 [Colletotrichum falcatum]|nr:hypothetical protein LX36DRAFT_219081 [Colletotrichum falcatum]